jgi:hypothetical protein
VNRDFRNVVPTRLRSPDRLFGIDTTKRTPKLRPMPRLLVVRLVKKPKKQPSLNLTHLSLAHRQSLPRVINARSN